jgi:iron complex transport system ATP-binding protein
MSNLQLRDVSFSYSNSNGFILNHVSLAVKKTQRVVLIGPNGSGKTTILKLATGVLSPKEGTILLGERDISKLSRREIAQEIAVVPQYFNIPFAFSVEEIVMLGRTPFIRTLSSQTERDYMAVKYALDMTKIEGLKSRAFNELSGGERQRVILAMALAQQPGLLLLDEPTTHLDISQQIEMLKLVNQLNDRQGTTIIAAMHDLNLAAMYFERIILLKEGQIVADGAPEEILTSYLIKDVFSVSVQVQQHPTGVPQIIILP